MGGSYPLTPMQEGMLFNSLSLPGSGVDIEHVQMDIAGSLDSARLQASWAAVISMYPLLSSRFEWQDVAQPQRIESDEVQLPWVTLDWKTQSESQQKESWQVLLQKDRKQGFNLSKGPVMRMTAVALADEQWRLLWSFHHIILDGRAFPLVLGELWKQYDADVAGECLVDVTESDFSRYQQWLSEFDLNLSRGYWEERMAPFSGATPLPWHPPLAKDLNPIRRSIFLEEADWQALQNQAKNCQVGISTLLEAAWAIVLCRHSNEGQAWFAVTTSARRDSVSAADDIVGLLINTLPRHIVYEPGRPIGEWLADIRTQQKLDRPNQHLPLTEIQRCAGVSRNDQFLESLVVYDHATLDQYMAPHSNNGQRRFTYEGQTNFPLTLLGYGGKQLLLQLECDAEHADAAMAQRLLGQVQQVLKGFAVAVPSDTLSQIQLLPAEESAVALATAGECKIPLCLVPELFQQQVQRQPEAIAVSCSEEANHHGRLTYQALAAKVDVLASNLMAAGVKVGDRVAVAARRDLDLVIACMATLRAGAIYVPTEPKLPEARLRKIWQLADISVLLTSASLDLPTHDYQAMSISCTEVAGQNPLADEFPHLQAEDGAYLIFTSGTTGEPKGVLVPHGALANFCEHMAAEPGFSSQDSLLAVAGASFDLSITELLLPLTCGGRVHVASESQLENGESLVEEMRQEKISYIQATPTTFRWLLSSGWEPQPSQRIVSGGEPVDAGLARQLANCDYWIGYGPTETTILMAASRNTEPNDIHIGKVFRNVRQYVVNQAFQLQPLGAVGELVIGGTCLASGYWQKPELTQEKFVDDPWFEGGRLYHSGDLGRLRPDGNFECLGRFDNQVKLRGYRIELEEIEAVLADQPGIAQAAVTLWGAGTQDAMLVGYFVAQANAEVSAVNLKDALGKAIPAYMVPARLEQLDSLPLTANRKVDRKALPKPDTQTLPNTGNYVAPSTALQRNIATAWQSVLSVAQVGIHDNFFDVGGDSLKILRLLAQLRSSLQSSVEMSVVNLFEKPTIAEFSQWLEKMATTDSVDGGKANAQERAEKRKDALSKRKNNTAAARRMAARKGIKTR